MGSIAGFLLSLLFVTGCATACASQGSARGEPASDSAHVPSSSSADSHSTPASVDESRAAAPGPASVSYAEVKRSLAARKADLAAQWGPSGGNEDLVARTEAEIVTAVRLLSSHWLGTRWGLGAPQISEPGAGKINCGTFVGTVLRDSGFNVDVKKLQRQPSQLIIASFVSGERVRKFSNSSMEKFLQSVRSMGPGLYIIGLDFHVGLLLQTPDDLRFIHASFETETVVDEPAATAAPIVTSGYRVVGKLLSAENLQDWIEGRKIRVVGNW